MSSSLPRYTPQLAKALYKRFIMIGRAFQNNRFQAYTSRADISDAVPKRLRDVAEFPRAGELLQHTTKFSNMVNIRQLAGNYVIHAARTMFRCPLHATGVPRKGRVDTSRISTLPEHMTLDDIFHNGLRTLYMLERVIGLRPKVIVRDLDGPVLLSSDDDSLLRLSPQVQQGIAELERNPFLRPQDLDDPRVQRCLDSDDVIIDIHNQAECNLLKKTMMLHALTCKSLNISSVESLHMEAQIQHMNHLIRSQLQIVIR